MTGEYWVVVLLERETVRFWVAERGREDERERRRGRQRANGILV